MRAHATCALFHEHLKVRNTPTSTVFRQNLSPNVDARALILVFEQEIKNNAPTFVNQVAVRQRHSAQFRYRLQRRIKNERPNDVLHTLLLAFFSYECSETRPEIRMAVPISQTRCCTLNCSRRIVSIKRFVELASKSTCRVVGNLPE